MNIYLFILFLFIIRESNPATAGSARTNVKKGEKKERIRGEKREEKRGLRQRLKPHVPTLAIDALIGDEEQTGKKEERTKKETGSGSPTQVPWSPPTTRRDHTVILF